LVQLGEKVGKDITFKYLENVSRYRNRSEVTLFESGKVLQVKQLKPKIIVRISKHAITEGIFEIKSKKNKKII